MPKKLAIISLAVFLAITVIVTMRRDNASAVPQLIDQTQAAGVDHIYDGEFAFFVGGGVATFDCNNDYKPELYFAGGSNQAALYLNQSKISGSLDFKQKMSPTTDLKFVTGAYPLDIDGDDLIDLAVLRRGGNTILRGRGDCTFEEYGSTLGIDAGSDWTVSFAATWEQNASMPTLVFGSYLVPESHTCGTSRLWRPNGDHYDDSLPLDAHCTLSLLFSDWNHDGGVDLRVSNDRNYDLKAREQLWRIRPGEAISEYTESSGWRDLTIWGMGIASQDITGDGKPEVYLTSQADNKLQTLDSDATNPSYRDIALERGVTAHRPYLGGDVLPSTAWHPEFDDLNNDGIFDLFVTKGNVDIQIDYAKNDPNNLLIGLSDGTFIERGGEAGIANDARSRGAAVVDLNLDGLLDLVVVNRRVPVEIRQNVGSGTIDSPTALGNWLAIRLHQPSPNTNAIGAWVDVKVDQKVTTREITVGGGHASGEVGWIHFGLGNAQTAEVRVNFPGASAGEWMKVDGNAFYEITRGSQSPSKWQPSE